MPPHDSDPKPRPTSPTDPILALLDSRIIGSSPPMVRLKSLLPRVARSHSSVLVNGESGTGKELIARAVHSFSPRSEFPFVAENCAALPEGVIESELFGHVRGAFTGADRDREGLIALADGGTLFLDEVGDLPPRIQAKLLRVIQEGEFRPVGSRHLKRSDFRVISATHRDLISMVRQGSFRGDLFYRLNVIQIRIPPLRERIEDIPQLVEALLERLVPQRSEAARTVAAGVSREAMEMLLRYPWPGNIRELQNVIEAALVMAAEGIIGVGELPERVIDHALAEPEGTALGEGRPHEHVMLEMALARFKGDKAKAARYIGWSPPKLYRMMTRYGIPLTYGRGES
jgi:transcriptional regulator with PAS, ATPase and Fis domain